MQVSALRYFEEVARQGSIRRAAESLHVASSAISRQVRKLEEELRAPLFERHARGVRLTEAGAVFFRHARETLLDLERVQSELDALRGLRRGHVKICTVEGMLLDFVPSMLHRFHARNPGVTYEVTVGGTDIVTEAVAEDRAHIGLVYNFESHAAVTPVAGLRQPLLAVMSPAHPMAGRKRLTLAEVCAHPVAFPAEAFGIRRLLDEALSRLRLDVTPTLVTNSIDALKSFARKGIGSTFLPRVTMPGELEAGTLVAVPLTHPILSRSRVDIVVRKGRPLPLAAEALLNEMQDLLGQWRQ